ncbi:MAG: hypothetical protein E7527_04270 [Ruminococcaceae bacterium]|nr:hypothetical protein [Oscillospiraceae bacterium]
MEKIFLQLVNMSITAGWLVLAVMVLRLVLRNAPRWIHCLLWALVAVRLICPISIESDFSVVPRAGQVPVATVLSETPAVKPSTPVGEDTAPVVNAITPPAEPGEILSSTIPPETPTTAPVPETAVAQPSSWTLTRVLSLVWLVGVAAMLTYAVIATLRLYRRVGESVRLRENLYQCDGIATPFILGLIRPRIYLPSDLSEGDARSVVAHERAHIQRRDHWWKPLGFVLLSLYWFNPLLWVAYILLCRDIETACDEKVIRDMDAAQRKAYSLTILSCSAPRHLITACPVAFGETAVKSRVKTVLNYKKPAFWLVLVAVVALVVSSVCLLTNPKTTVAKEEENNAQTEEPNVAPAVITKVDSWQSLGHPMSYDEASKVSDGYPLEKYNQEKLQKILSEVKWYSDAALTNTLTFDAYFSLDGVTRYYLALDTQGHSGYLYNGSEYAALTEEQAGHLDFMLADGGSTIQATHVLYGNFAEWDKAERCFVLDVVQADDAALVGKKIRVNTQYNYGRGLPGIGVMLRAYYDGTVLENTVYAHGYGESSEEEIPNVNVSDKAQSGTVTGKVIYVLDKSVLLNCYDKGQFDVVWVHYGDHCPELKPQMNEEYQVGYNGQAMETYPPQLIAQTMTRVSSTPLNNGFISEERAIEIAVAHWKVRLGEQDRESGNYTTVYVMENPTADNPWYKMGSREVSEQNGEPGNSALYNTIYIDAVTGEVRKNASNEYITETRAIEIASAYWDIQPGDKDPDTGYVMSVHAMETPTEKNPYYRMALRWLVEVDGGTGNFSTLDTIYIHAVTEEIAVSGEEK